MELEKDTVTRNMTTYGGHFVQYLGVAIMYADSDNTERIKQAFPELWDKYLNWDDE